ncbi:MAG: aldo/keto reductase [Acetobacterales bacterium]
MATRRTILRGMLAATAAAALPVPAGLAQGRPVTRHIPSTGEAMPAIGLGSWITFNVGNDPELLNQCTDVMAAFLAGGGGMIDSSPMYGSSQNTIGHGLEQLGRPRQAFAADKVWTSDASGGREQISRSRREWGVPRFDLMQVHNLVEWQAHLRTLRDMKAAGEIRYIGITTSEGRRLDLFEEVMRDQPLDFVQVTYNILDREVEERILPLAEDRGMAVIANRPFRQKELIHRLRRYPLPPWAGEIGATSWAQFVLKFIVTHPAVTVTIPATTRVDHVRENLAAAADLLPDAATRRRMADYVRDL